MLEFLTQSNWTDRIGWVLVHSLWQLTLVGLVAFVLQRALLRRSASTRYGVLLVTMCIVIAAPIVTWFSQRANHTAELAVNPRRSENLVENVPSRGDSPSGSWASIANGPMSADWLEEPGVQRQSAPRRPRHVEVDWAVSLSMIGDIFRPWLPQIVFIWCLGVLVASTRLIVGWRTVRRMRRTGISEVGDSVREALGRAANKLRLNQAIEVLQSTLVKTPIVIGHFRPVVLLPLRAVTGLSESQLELILAHELAHIRRHDYLVNLLQTLVETLFFYHPGVWWLSRQIRIERENCCDDVAMAATGSRADYGRALLAIEELQDVLPLLSLGARGGSLLARIRRIAGCEPAPSVAGAGSIGFTILVSIALLVAVAWAAAPPSEEPSPADALTQNAVTETVDQPSALLTATGKVVDTAGKPVAGASVYLREWSTSRISSDPYNQSPQDVLATTYTDDDGAFRFEKVPAKPFPSDQWLREKPWDIVVVAKSCSLAWRHMLTPHPSHAFEIVLQPGATVTGRVVDREALPIEGAKVRVFGIFPLGQEPRYDWAHPGTLDLQGSQLAPSAKSDGDGRFEIHGLPRETLLRVLVTHDDFDREFLHVATTNEPQPGLAVTRRIDAEMAKVHPSNFTVQLGPAPPRITGRVVAMETQNAIAGARIEGKCDSAWLYTTADDQGQFTLRYVVGSQCRVRVHGPIGSKYLGRLALVDIPRGATEVPSEIVLVPGEPLQGVVLAAETGASVPGVSVSFDSGFEWENPQDGALLSTGDSETDPRGRFRFLVPPGKGKVEIWGRAPGFDLPRYSSRVADLDPQFVKELEIVHGQTTPEVKFTLRRVGAPIPPGKGVITGRVVDAAGKPLAGAEVAPQHWFEHAGPGDPVPTDQEGRFWLRLQQLSHGDPMRGSPMVAIDQQRRLRGHTFLPENSTSETENTPLEIRLAPTGTIVGHVMDDDKPIVGAQVQADASEAVKDDPTDPQKVLIIYHAKTDQTGRFVMPLVEAGQGRLVATKTGWETCVPYRAARGGHTCQRVVTVCCYSDDPQ
jgi:beta-lactamase regulating signal transducer with metallopeptidase domain